MKVIKILLIISGVLLLAYGSYRLIAPDEVLNLGIAKLKAQNNNNPLITIGMGLTAVVFGAFPKGRRVE